MYLFLQNWENDIPLTAVYGLDYSLVF